MRPRYSLSSLSFFLALAVTFHWEQWYVPLHFSALENFHGIWDMRCGKLLIHHSCDGSTAEDSKTALGNLHGINRSDMLNHLYLLQADGPRAGLVSQPLTGENYSTWRGWWLWLCQPKIIWVLLIVVYLKKTLAHLIMHYGDGAVIWTYSNCKIIQLVKSVLIWVVVYRKHDTMKISIYLTELKAYWDELCSYDTVLPCACGAISKNIVQQEEDKIIQFLMRLSDTFNAVRG